MAFWAPVRFTVLAVLSLTLAGCIQGLQSPVDSNAAVDLAGFPPTVTHLAGGIVTDAVGDLPAARALLREIGHDAGEPTLGITSTGTIFYAAIKFEATPAGGSTPVTDVLRSRDGGKTWEDVTPRFPTGHNAPPQTGDPYVYVDPATDRVFQFEMFPALACSWVSWSDDEGDTWDYSPVGCGTPPPYDHQTLVAGAPRMDHAVQTYPSVLYGCVNRISDSICSRSFDGGRTWVAGTPVFTGVDPALVGPDTLGTLQGFCGGLHGHAVAAPDGTVYLPREYCGRPFVGVSRDDGTTWTAVQVSDVPASGGPDPAVAVDAAGNAYYAFVDDAGLLYLSVSRDAGATWSEAVVVSAPAVTAAHLPTIAAGDEGHVVVAYAGTENLPDGFKNEDFEKYSLPWEEPPETPAIDSATWNGYVAVVTNALDDAPVIQTAMVNDPADPLVRGYCGPGRCPGMYDFIDVVVAPDGRPFAAFVDACIETCATDEGTHEDSQGAKQGRAGLIATLATGPKLIGGGSLPALD